MSNTKSPISVTMTIGKGHPHAFSLIMAAAEESTVLFIFKHSQTGLLLRQGLEREDLHLYVVPPESP